MSSLARRQLTACGLANLAALCCVFVGCSPAAPEVANNIPPGPVEVALVDRAEFDAVLAGLQGKVVLVDCWATWCRPCVEQLPHSVALAKVHAADGLAVVTLDFDDPDAVEQVRKLLDSAGAGAPGVINFQCKLGSSPNSMTEFEITSGALPHYKLYDRAGKLVRTFDFDPAPERQFTPADVESAVVELLAK